jgi:hypothetical protein
MFIISPQMTVMQLFKILEEKRMAKITSRGIIILTE